MARVTARRDGLRRMLQDPGIRQACVDVAEAIQDHVVQLNAVEAVDTGLMAASWRVADVSGPSGVTIRVHNFRRADGEPDGYNYPLAIEVGNENITGRHLLLRSIDAGRR